MASKHILGADELNFLCLTKETFASKNANSFPERGFFLNEYVVVRYLG
jgi:hypothetical protein